MADNQPVACRSCGYVELQSVLSLGCTPLANALLTEQQRQEPEETYPLELVLCPQCSLVQITETVAPEKLFREYVYLSSFSDTMVQHAEEIDGCHALACVFGIEVFEKGKEDIIASFLA